MYYILFVLGSYSPYSYSILQYWVRFLLHTDKLQCHKVERTTSSLTSNLTSTMTSSLTSQSLVQASWSCPGLCGLRSNQAEQPRKKKRSVMDAIRRKISRTE